MVEVADWGKLGYGYELGAGRGLSVDGLSEGGVAAAAATTTTRGRQAASKKA